MKISPTFAGRDDLSSIEKWKFSIEESIENNKKVRAFYRRYYFLPQWMKDTIEIYFIITSLPPLFLAAVMCLGLQKILSDEYMEEDTGFLGLTLYVILVGTATYFHPLGWVMVYLTFQFVIFILFAGTMRDYDFELQKEAKNKKATR